MAGDEDEVNAESGEFQPTLTDTLYSSLQLPEDQGHLMLIQMVLEELLTALRNRGVLSSEDLENVLDKAGARASSFGKRADGDSIQAIEEKRYPQSYLDEIFDRTRESAEMALSRIRKRLSHEPD